MDSTLAFRFFGQLVIVNCDDDDVAQALRLIYERQLTGDGSSETDAVHVRVEADGPDGPRIVVGDRTVRAPSPNQLLHYAHLVLVNAAAASATDVRVLHAGAVERQGRAVVLVAPSGGGKTTTTLALARRGWRILSDDFAVLGNRGDVRPFVRRLNLTDETLGLLNLQPPPGAVRVATSSRGGKWMIDADELDQVALGQTANLCAVFVLEPRLQLRTASEEPVEGLGEPASQTWRLQLDHAPDGLHHRISSIDGVVDVSSQANVDGTIMEVAVEREARIVPALDRALASFDVTALSISRPEATLKAPTSRPCVEPLSIGDAAKAILPHDLGLSGRRFLYGTDEDDVKAAWTGLSTSMADAGRTRFRLWPGELDATVDLIEAHVAI